MVVVKKGDVYKEAKGGDWFTITDVHQGSIEFKRHDEAFYRLCLNGWDGNVIRERIRRGGLIKIPQLYK